MDSKGALLSSGVWGALLTFVPMIDQIVAQVNLLPGGFINDSISLVVGAIGSILALRGRLKASKKIQGLI